MILLRKSPGQLDGFLEALPGAPAVDIWWILTGFGIVSFLLPAVIALVYLAGIAPRDLTLVEPILATTLYLYLILLAVMAGARREGFVALVGVLVMLSLFMGAVALMLMVGEWRNHSWIAIISPAASFAEQHSPDFGPESAAVLAGQFFVCVALGSIAAWRFVHLPSRRGRRSSASAATGLPVQVPSHPSPRFSFHLPLFWKEWREQRGVVLGTGIICIAIAAFSSIIEGWRQNHGKLRPDSTLFFTLLLMTGLMTPTIVAVILGQSAFSEDLRLDGFWRTRPISPFALYGVKLLTALSGIVLLLVMLVIIGTFGVMSVDPNKSDGPGT